jgi:hypothetical protein
MEVATLDVSIIAKLERGDLPRSPGTLTTALTTAEEMRIPIPQHMQTQAVTYGLKTVGTTSLA